MPETRKVQLIGNTLFVSLPKPWTNKVQLKRGDPVMLVPQSDNSMIIYPTAKQEKPKEIIVEINPEHSQQYLTRIITAAYVDGFDIIKLRAEERLTEEQQDIIREIIEHLFGLEIIEVTGKTITMECLLKQDLQVDKSIQRIHNVILSMFGETFSALKKQDANLVKGLKKRMHYIKRLSLVVNRLLRSMVIFPRSDEVMEVSLIDCVDYLKILHIITEIADNVNRISESVKVLCEQELPKYILEPLFHTFISIQEMYQQSIQALLSMDIPLANRILDSKLTSDNLWKLYIEADEKSEISCFALSYSYLLIDNIKQIQQYVTEIAEIAIERAEAVTSKKKVEWE